MLSQVNDATIKLTVAELYVVFTVHKVTYWCEACQSTSQLIHNKYKSNLCLGDVIYVKHFQSYYMLRYKDSPEIHQTRDAPVPELFKFYY